jgi:hypothetical protein
MEKIYLLFYVGYESTVILGAYTDKAWAEGIQQEYGCQMLEMNPNEWVQESFYAGSF